MNYRDLPRPAKHIFKIFFKEQVGPNIVKIRLQAESALEFIPGQFVTLYIDERTRRSYSISSMPGFDFLETYNDNTPLGPGSQFFINCVEGQEIEAMFPLGRFTYNESDSPAVFIATGTGITPFKSMIDTALRANNTKRKIQLTWAVKTEKELFLLNELEELKNNFGNFDFKIFVTRQEDTKYHYGRFSSFIIENNFERESEFYICGGKNMITDVETILIEKGFPPEKIKYEQFY